MPNCTLNIMAFLALRGELNLRQIVFVVSELAKGDKFPKFIRQRRPNVGFTLLSSRAHINEHVLRVNPDHETRGVLDHA